MKKLLIIPVLLCATLVFGQIETPQPSPAATISQSIGLAKATIEYSRPSLKGRKILGTELAPYGKVWRTGANKIPNLILTDEVTIEGNKVPAGTYGIATIPNENEWVVILTKNPKQWGVYDYKESEDLLRLKVKTEKLTMPEENFTMSFTDYTPSSASVAISWENTQIKFVIKHDADAKIMAQIKTKTADPKVTTDELFTAADYYYETNRDIKQAFEWADKVLLKEKEYWTYYLHGKIAAKLGNCPVAIDDATKGLALAEKANDGAYVLNHKKVLKSCGK
jgi:Protein of unknown function (DUF2911)